MAYFPDLTPCTYYRDPEEPEEKDDFPPLIAVGWLDANHPFPLGDPGRAVYERLKAFAAMKWQPVMFMGGHHCEFCQHDQFYSDRELFIPSESVTYAVPLGVVHYVACHRYRSPDEFCEALLRCPDPDSPEFFKALQAVGWPERVARPDNPPTPVVQRVNALSKAMETQGIAQCAAVEAFRTLHGHLPQTLEEARSVTTAPLPWAFTPVAEGYRVHAEWTIDRVRLVFDSDVGLVTAPDGGRMTLRATG